MKITFKNKSVCRCQLKASGALFPAKIQSRKRDIIESRCFNGDLSAFVQSFAPPPPFDCEVLAQV